MNRNSRSKILNLEEMIKERNLLKSQGKKLVFTNGCFDILHAGHADYLAFARAQGDCLLVGMNSDASVKKIKGPSRPIVKEENRAKLLAALEVIDYVVLFDEEEPLELIRAVLPDVLVKGEDWKHYVSGREVVEENGGKVVLAPLVEGLSTTNIINRIQGQA